MVKPSRVSEMSIKQKEEERALIALQKQEEREKAAEKVKEEESVKRERDERRQKELNSQAQKTGWASVSQKEYNS